MGRIRRMRSVSHCLVVTAVGMLLAGPWAAADAQSSPPPPQEQLLSGVGRIAAPGVPGPLCVYGPEASAVVVGGSGGATRLPVVAVADLGEGRVVAFGHDGYFGPEFLEQSDTGRLMSNAVRWAGRSERPSLAVLSRPELAAWLRGEGFDVAEVTAAELATQDAVLFVPWAQSDEELGLLADYAGRGGGLVMAATGWGWAQLHPGQSLQTAYAGNRLLAPAGIQWANDWLDETAAEGGYAVDGPPSELTGAGPALSAALGHEDGSMPLSDAQLAQVSRTLVANAVCAPSDDGLFLPRLRAAISDDVVPSPQDPVTASEVLDRVAVTLQTRHYFSLPVDAARAHPAAAVFPGAVEPTAPRLADVDVAVDTSVPGWHSTGLYAPAGEPLSVRLPAAAVRAGMALQIGAHTDKLWSVAGDWTRMPEVTRSWPLDRAETTVFNPFGGLVYVTVPDEPGLEEPIVVARFDGVVRAPTYRSGMDFQQWRLSVAGAPGPWGELAGRNMIVTVPSQTLRNSPDPAAAVDAWDRLLDVSAELATEPTERARPERFVADQQLAYGYMHAGYPLYCHLDQAGHMVDGGYLTTEGNWGFFHEVGHNHQRPEWTFSGTGEVTVNLFTLYAFDRLVGIPPLAHERGDVDFVRAQMAKYDFTQPDFAQWKSDPFLALAMYVQLQHAFGWDAYRAVFGEYRDLADDDRPRTDDQKRDQWLVRFSRQVGHDLGPFVTAWGVPTSQQARAAVGDLPEWMPRGFPETYMVDPTAEPTQSATAVPTPSETALPTGAEVSDDRSRLFVPAACNRGG